MRRAEPMTQAVWSTFSDRDGGHPTEAIKPWITQSTEYYIPGEMKMDSFGILDGNIVIFDYGN